MYVKDKLQLILITYNRANHVKNTLTKLLSEDSPVKDFDLLVIDNNSTDNTAKIVSEFMQNHENITYVKNRYNLGLAGNISKAMISANKDYVWILGDDDKYDFSNWAEVEQAINNNEKLICVARYILPSEKKESVAQQLFQLTFITGGIYNTSLFNDVTVKNIVDNIYTLFPHLPPIIKYINDGGKIYVVDKAISDNGMNIETTDCSYTRGINNKSELYDRTNEMSWVLGYSNVISLLKDKNLQKECLQVSIPYKDIYGSWENFYNCLQNQYINTGKINYFLEIYNVLPENHKKHFDLNNIFSLAKEYKNLAYNYEILKNDSINLKNKLENIQGKIDNISNYCLNLSDKFDNIYNMIANLENKNNDLDFKLNYILEKNKTILIQKIFSVKNEDNHKVVRILGIKIKFRRKR